MDGFFLKIIEVPPIVIGCLLGRTLYRRRLLTWRNILIALLIAHIVYLYIVHYGERDTSLSLWLNIDEPRAFLDFIRYYSRFLFFGICFFPYYYVVQIVFWGLSLSDPRTGKRVFLDSLYMTAFVATMRLPCLWVIYAYLYLMSFIGSLVF